MRGLRLAASFAFIFLITPGAECATTLLQRAFVSALSGSDSNPCSRQLPCRNFAAAIAAAAPSGEVIALDSGGYGSFTIDKAITVTAPPGIYAGIAGFSGAAITIASGMNDNVNLRGLSLNGQGGPTGIEMTSANNIHIDHCWINGFVAYGINASSMEPRVDSGITIRDTTVQNGNRHASNFESIGIAVTPHMTVDGSHIDGFAAGIASSSYQLAVRNSTVDSCAYGVMALGGASDAIAVIDHTSFVDNTYGVWAGPGPFSSSGAIVTVSDSYFAYGSYAFGNTPAGYFNAMSNKLAWMANAYNGSASNMFSDGNNVGSGAPASAIPMPRF